MTLGKWTYRIAVIAMIAAIAVGAIYWIMLQTNPETMTGPWIDPDYPTGTGWLLYPNGGETVSGTVTIRWDPDKTSQLDSEDEIWIAWTHDPRGASSTFEHETWEGCYCSRYNVITESAPNTGSYQWNANEVLEQCDGETYPYYIKIVGGKYMDASNKYFSIVEEET